MTEAQRWTAGALAAGSTAKPVFSFTYDGKPVGELLKACEFKPSERKIDEQRTERTLAWIDSKTGFEVRCVSVEYADFPVVEWTVYLHNAGGRLVRPVHDHGTTDATLVQRELLVAQGTAIVEHPFPSFRRTRCRK